MYTSMQMNADKHLATYTQEVKAAVEPEAAPSSKADTPATAGRPSDTDKCNIPRSNETLRPDILRVDADAVVFEQWVEQLGAWWSSSCFEKAPPQRATFLHKESG